MSSPRKIVFPDMARVAVRRCSCHRHDHHDHHDDSTWLFPFRRYRHRRLPMTVDFGVCAFSSFLFALRFSRIISKHLHPLFNCLRNNATRF